MTASQRGCRLSLRVTVAPGCARPWRRPLLALGTAGNARATVTPIWAGTGEFRFKQEASADSTHHPASTRNSGLALDLRPEAHLPDPVLVYV